MYCATLYAGMMTLTVEPPRPAARGQPNCSALVPAILRLLVRVASSLGFESFYESDRVNSPPHRCELVW